MSTDHADYDIVVIGGGINGAGIARDAALRGLRVLLLEKSDFGGGTTAWSSRLIHGGLRYLEYAEIPLVFESLHERRRLRRVAAHLITRLRLTIPIYRDSRRSKIIIRIGMIAYDLLSIGKKNPRHKILSRAELLKSEPGLRSVGLVGGAQYFDAQVTFAERLVLENIIAARSAGADVRNYSPVIGINVRQSTVHALQFADHASGKEIEVNARIIINAAGPWVDKVLATVNREMPRFMGGTKGSHIVVGPFDGAPDSAYYVEAEQDGRPFFIIPWNKQYLIGTTDIRYEGDPGDVKASREEIDYLLAETNRVFPSAGLSFADIHFTYAGVRPLPRQEKGPESAITRKHIIFKHKDEAGGLISIIGGKLTTYRNLAEQAVDAAVRLSGRRAKPCQTRSLLLPGAVELDDASEKLGAAIDLSPSCVERLLGIYGSRAVDLVEKAREDSPCAFLDVENTVLAAEVTFSIQDEMAVSLIDIMYRRMMVGLNADQGMSMVEDIASIAARVADWDKSERVRQLKALQEYAARFRTS